VRLWLNTIVSLSYLKCQVDFKNTFPKSQVSDESTVFRLVSRFSEALRKVVVTRGREWIPGLQSAVDTYCRTVSAVSVME
jgi:hypothetical protein